MTDSYLKERALITAAISEAADHDEIAAMFMPDDLDEAGEMLGEANGLIFVLLSGIAHLRNMTVDEVWQELIRLDDLMMGDEAGGGET